ncbi:MAG: hypothetical protein AAGH89_05425 [Verrucomicrobiota bacterium]
METTLSNLSDNFDAVFGGDRIRVHSETVATPFEQTRWSLIQRAASDGEATREEAWREFHELYRAPLLWFIRSHGWPEDEAADHLQSFLAKLAEHNWLREAEAEQVKLRTFLLLRLKRHLNDIRKRQNALKRGGKAEIVSASDDEELLGPSGDSPSEQVQLEFDRRWAQAILDRAMARLRSEAERRGNLTVFDVLSSQLTGESPGLLQDAATRLGKTEGAIRMVLNRQRERLRVVLREEVAETISPGSDISEEVRYLAEVLV